MEQNLKEINFDKLCEVVNKVYRTKNYSIFSHHPDNRDQTRTQKHLSVLELSMKLNGWSQGSYIIVDEFGRICNGGHRFEVAKRLGIEIEFIVIKGLTFKQIMLLNQKHKNYPFSVILEKYCEHGNKDYIVLRNFMKEYEGLNITESGIILMNTHKDLNRDDFEDGLFRYSNLNTAREWGTMLMSLKPYFDHWNTSLFVRTMTKVFLTKHTFNFSRLLKKVEKGDKNTVLRHMGSVKEYKILLNDIYNKGLKEKETINFLV